MTNRTLVLIVGLGAFAGGFTIGILAGHRPASSDRDPVVAPRSEPPTSLKSEDSASDEGIEPQKEAARLKKRVLDLEVELRTLRESPQKSARTESDREFAERFFEDYLELESAPSKPKDPDRVRELLGRLGRLDEKSSNYFIERYRKAKDSEASHNEKSVALELALASGGPTTAEFINLLLNDSTLDPTLRANLLDELSGMSGSFFSIKRLPVAAGLEGTAMTLARSDKPEERRGAAGLLGGVRTEVARSELRRFVEQDSDLGVKAAAVLSLGHVGDVSTRTYLEALWASRGSSYSGKDGAKVRDAIEAALKELAESRR